MRHIYKLDEGDEEIPGDEDLTLFELTGCHEMMKEWQIGYTTAMNDYKATRSNKNSNKWNNNIKEKMKKFQSAWKKTIN